MGGTNIVILTHKVLESSGRSLVHNYFLKDSVELLLKASERFDDLLQFSLGVKAREFLCKSSQEHIELHEDKLADFKVDSLPL